MIHGVGAARKQALIRGYIAMGRDNSLVSPDIDEYCIEDDCGQVVSTVENDVLYKLLCKTAVRAEKAENLISKMKQDIARLEAKNVKLECKLEFKQHPVENVDEENLYLTTKTVMQEKKNINGIESGSSDAGRNWRELKKLMSDENYQYERYETGGDYKGYEAGGDYSQYINKSESMNRTTESLTYADVVCRRRTQERSNPKVLRNSVERHGHVAECRAELRACKFCTEKHIWGRKQCKAYGKRCEKCMNMNHNANSCYTKTETIKKSRSLPHRIQKSKQKGGSENKEKAGEEFQRLERKAEVIAKSESLIERINENSDEIENITMVKVKNEDLGGRSHGASAKVDQQGVVEINPEKLYHKSYKNEVKQSSKDYEDKVKNGRLNEEDAKRYLDQLYKGEISSY